MPLKGQKVSKVTLVLFVFSLTVAAPLWADVKQIKLYKEAFPDEKPKCACCHVSEKPKKEEGQHDLNEYGKKVRAIKEAPDADTYKQAGPGGEVS